MLLADSYPISIASDLVLLNRGDNFSRLDVCASHAGEQNKIAN